MSEEEDNVDDETGSDVEEKLTSSQSKTRSYPPNIVGKNHLSLSIAAHSRGS